MWKTLLVCMEVLTIDIKAKEGFVEEKNYLPSKKKKKRKATKQLCTIISHVASLKCKPAAMFCAKPPCYQRHFWLSWCWSPGQADDEDREIHSWYLAHCGLLFWTQKFSRDVLWDHLSPLSLWLLHGHMWREMNWESGRFSVDLKMKEKQSLSSFLIKPWDNCFKKKECAAQLF